MYTTSDRKGTICRNLFIILVLFRPTFADENGAQRNITATMAPCKGTSGDINCSSTKDSGTSSTEELIRSTTEPFFLTSRPLSTTTEGDSDYYDYYSYYGYDDDYGDDDFVRINTTMVEVFINSSRAQAYIASFEGEFQRMLIEETLRYCPYIKLCNFTFGLGSPSTTVKILEGDLCCSKCSCQSDCVFERTCCPDYRSLPLVTGSQDSGTIVKPTCMAPVIRKHPMEWSIYDDEIRVYQNCPTDTDPNLHFKCVGSYTSFSNITLDYVIPMSDRITSKTYRNRYCAICNGVNITNLTKWESNLECLLPPSFASETDLLSGIINGTMPCVLSFVHQPTLDVDYCAKRIVSCNATGQWKEFDPEVERACGVYESTIGAVVGLKLLRFKNYFCALCNGIIPSKFLCSGGQDDKDSAYPFSGLLRLDTIKESSSDQETTCGPGELFDELKNRCQTVTCPIHRKFNDGLCESFLGRSSSIGYRVFSVVRPSEQINLEHLYAIMPTIRTKYKEILDSFAVVVCTSQTLITSDLKDTNEETTKHDLVDGIELLYDILPVVGQTIDATVDILLGIDGLNITATTDSGDSLLFHVYLKDDIRGYSKRLTYGQFFNWSLPETPVPLQDLIGASFVEDGRVFVPFLNWNEESGNCVEEGTFIRLLTMKPCPMFSVDSVEFGLSETSLGLGFVNGDKPILNTSDYVIVENTTFFKMCVDTYKRVLRDFVINDDTADVVYSTELIISIISVSLSIVCLVVSLFTYSCVPQMQTLPGKNNMALIVSLLLAQGTYFLSSFGSFDTGSFSCKLVGGLTHFFWLLAIFWMNICTFHMFRVLVRTRNVSSMARSKKHVLYHVYAMIMSITFVTGNIIASMVTSGYTDYGYGNTRCYVSTQRMLEITLGIPALVVVVANLSMFITIIVKLKRAPTVNKNVKNERNYLLVFAKLSTITGATWLFGFVYMWTGILAFSYIFTILNGSQGLFLMLSFVCNGRTVVMLKDRSSSLKSFFTGAQSTGSNSNTQSKRTKSQNMAENNDTKE